MTYMTTYTGTRVFPLDPFHPDIKLVDVAHHLSRLCRYTGATVDHYSVAQHSVILSHMVPRDLAGWALMHDAAEAYFNDVSHPLKRSGAVPGYIAAEENFMGSVWVRFQMPPGPGEPEIVRLADRYLCYHEMVQLGHAGYRYDDLPPKPDDVLMPPMFTPLEARDAKILFLERALDLADQGQIAL